MQVTSVSRLALTTATLVAVAVHTTTGCVVTDDVRNSDITSMPACDDAQAFCLGCRGEGSCGGATPICQAGACTACTANAQCASGVCDMASGACLSAAAVVYVAPGGNGMACAKNEPCATLQLAAAAIRADRHAIVLAPGTYNAGAVFDAAFDIEVYGEHAAIEDGAVASTIRTTGAGMVSIHDLTVRSQETSFACDPGASLSLVRVELRSMLGVNATHCANLAVVDSSFHGPGVGIFARADGPDASQVTVTNTTFADSTMAIHLRNTAATLSGLTIANARAAIRANVKCANSEACVVLTDSSISGAKDKTLELVGRGFLVARNHIVSNPAGGVKIDANVVRLESNIIQLNGAADAASLPAIALVANKCPGCAEQVVVIGNSVSRNRSSSLKGAGVLAEGDIVPVLASNIIYDNFAFMFNAPQVACQRCNSYNDLIQPATTAGTMRVAPLHGDPLFTSAFGGDLRPLPASPARNAGTCDTPQSWVVALTADVEGKPRSQPCDAGAYEIP